MRAAVFSTAMFDGHRSFYVHCTFQKSGALNFRMPWTFFRKAVGINHSPQGTYTTSLRATFWISSAIALRFLWSVALRISLGDFCERWPYRASTLPRG